METRQTKPPQRKMEVRTIFWVREVRRRQSMGTGMIQIPLLEDVSLGYCFSGDGGGGLKDLRVEDDVDAAATDEEFGNVDAVAGDGRLP